MITAAADGSALGNPGPAGWAWYVDDDCWAAGGWPHATNNQGELKAVLELFRATAQLDDELLVQCDSQYVINAVTKWMPAWKRKNWRKADGKAVMNLELLQQLDAQIAGRRYRFEWVRGHIGHPLNEAADARARAVAEAYQRNLEIPAGPGWTRGGPAIPSADPDNDPVVDPVVDPAVDGTTDPIFDADADADPDPDDALFALDGPADSWRTLSLELSVDEHTRLIGRAREAGVAPEEYLRGLI